MLIVELCNHKVSSVKPLTPLKITSKEWEKGNELVKIIRILFVGNHWIKLLRLSYLHIKIVITFPVVMH